MPISVVNGSTLFDYKWRNWKLHLLTQETMGMKCSTSVDSFVNLELFTRGSGDEQSQARYLARDILAGEASFTSSQ
jgi:hypothetical protein